MSNITLADWAQIVIAVATLATAIVAVIAAKQSHDSAKENRLTTEELARPRLSVFVQSTAASKQLVDLIVINSGQSSARNIKFKVEGEDLKVDYQSAGVEVLSQLRVIKKGVKLLEPGGKRTYFIISLIGRYEDLLETKTTVEVIYNGGPTSKQYAEEFPLDFASLSESGWRTEETKAAKETVSELKKISKHLHQIAQRK